MQKVTKAVIPTAGLGTRFLPVTKAVPKSMLPILDTPTVDYIVDEAVAAGITDIIIITSHNTDVIERHFAENLPLEKRLVADGKTELYEILKKITSRAKITFVKQDVLNGLKICSRASRSPFFSATRSFTPRQGKSPVSAASAKRMKRRGRPCFPPCASKRAKFPNTATSA